LAKSPGLPPHYEATADEPYTIGRASDVPIGTPARRSGEFFAHVGKVSAPTNDRRPTTNDYSTVFRFVAVVVTAKTAGELHVAEVARNGREIRAVVHTRRVARLGGRDRRRVKRKIEWHSVHF
jgi:hypothetical protein